MFPERDVPGRMLVKKVLLHNGYFDFLAALVSAGA